MPSDAVTIKWYVGLAQPRREPIAKIVTLSNPSPASWVERLMSRNPNSLANRIRRGEVKSAWGDMDEPDGTGLRSSRITVPTSIESDAEQERFKREQDASRKRQEEAIERVKRAQLEAAELERKEREEAALEALEGIEGFGSF